MPSAESSSGYSSRVDPSQSLGVRPRALKNNSDLTVSQYDNMGHISVLLALSVLDENAIIQIYCYYQNITLDIRLCINSRRHVNELKSLDIILLQLNNFASF